MRIPQPIPLMASLARFAVRHAFGISPARNTDSTDRRFRAYRILQNKATCEREAAGPRRRAAHRIASFSSEGCNLLHRYFLQVPYNYTQLGASTATAGAPLHRKPVRNNPDERRSKHPGRPITAIGSMRGLYVSAATVGPSLRGRPAAYDFDRRLSLVRTINMHPSQAGSADA